MTNFSGENLNAACGGMDSRRNGVAEVSTKYLVEAAKNAVPAGYKQTELGVIPEDWECIPSKEIVSYLGGFAFSSKAATTDGIRWLKIANVGLNEVKWDAESYLPASYSQVHQEYLLRESDVVMALTRPILGESLKVAILNETDAPALLNQRVAKLVPKNAGDQRFLYYLVQTSNFIAAMNLAMAGSDPPNIGTRALGDISVQVPKLPKEQTAIANALSDVDALISEQEKLIAKKQAIKTATMQQLLTGRTRLPQFALREDGTPKGTKPSELGEIPEDWEVNCFAECGYFQSGSGFPTKYQGEQEGDYPFFKVSDMNNVGNETFLISSNNYISESVKNSISAKVTPENAIVFAKIGAAIFLERKKICFQPSCIDNNMMAYIANEDKLQFKYAYLLFKNINLGQLVEATALPSLSGRDIGQKIVALPAAEEQTAIATILSDMGTEIEALEQRLSKTRQIKQGMMQELLTGRTRLI